MRRFALLASFVAVPLTAQGNPGSTRPLQVVVSGGAQVPTGSFGDYHDLGVHADVGLVVNIGGMRFRPELSYTRFKLKEVLTSPTAAAGTTGYSSDALSTLLGGFANLELPLGHGAVQPFVLGGLGAVDINSDATTSTDALKKVKASINIGAGIRFRMGGIGGVIEARLNNIPGSDPNAYFKDVKTIPVTFGLVF